MKYAILADIHSNLTALQAVLTDIENHGGADEIWCLGDTIGYGPDPHECLSIVRNRFSLCVAGNHDLAAIGKIDIANFNQDAARAALWNGNQLDEDEISFLSGLPLKIENGDFTLAHGSPRDPVWEYVLSDTDAKENLAYFKTRYCLVGHSHSAEYFRCGQFCTVSSPNAGTSINLKDYRYILNPGGVGQPRDGDPRAAYAVYNTETHTLVFQRVNYDPSAVQARMLEAGLPARLIDRLNYGR